MGNNVLDSLGILSATDKSSLRWDYLRHYQPIFAPFRDAEINILEIGVGGGNSLHMWRAYFSQATIVGIDIDERARRSAGGRIVIGVGSQTDTDFLDEICAKNPPTIIIDDGSHQAPHIMASFRHLFPRLPRGGLYVIEDLNITGSMTGMTPHEFFAQTAAAIMHRRPGQHPEPHLLAQIDRVEFAPGIAFIRKKDEAERLARLGEVGALVAQTTSANNYHWLAEVMMNELGRIDEAEAAARRAVELYPTPATYQLGLCAVLERKGDLAAAADVAQNAVVAEPGNYRCHLRLGDLQAQLGEIVAATQSLQRAVETAPPQLAGYVEGERMRILKRTA